MKLLGTWKLKEMMMADENGVRMLGRDEIAALPDMEEFDDLKKMLRADFILSKKALDTYYMPLAEEIPLCEEEGLKITKYGVLLDSYPAKIEDGVLMLDYEKDGEEYFAVPLDEEGCLVIADGMMKLCKV